MRQGTGDIGAVKETIQRLQEGHLLNIYPEGARTTDGEIGVMQWGFGLIIRRANVPVIPAVITGSFEAWPQWRMLFQPWPVRVRYGPPISVAGLSANQIFFATERTLRRMYDGERASQRHNRSSA